jgi:hypothetical protein
MRRVFLAFIWVAAANMATAQDRAQLDALAGAIGVPEVLEIMRLEGMETASELGESFLGRTDPGWAAAVDGIYDVDALYAQVLEGMEQVVENADVSAATAFFQSELGVRIVGLEVSAREALMDESIEAASESLAEKLEYDDPDRFELIENFIEINDLVESNVIGALNSNFAFIKGLASTGDWGTNVSENEMLAEVWSQEPDIRIETTKWLYSYLALAYRPLSDDELGLYLDFSASEHGRVLNRILFAGFDRMFNEVSRQLGESLAHLSTAEAL